MSKLTLRAANLKWTALITLATCHKSRTRSTAADEGKQWWRLEGRPHQRAEFRIVVLAAATFSEAVYHEEVSLQQMEQYHGFVYSGK